MKLVKSKLEEQFGVGFNVIAFTNTDQTQFACKTAFGQIENLITLPYEEGVNFSIFVFYTPLYEEEVAEQGQEQQQQEQEYMDEMNQEQEDEQVGIVRDDYEEPMKTVFRVYEDEQQFRQSSDQLKITFDSLEINPIKLESFSLIFQFIISPFPKEISNSLSSNIARG